MANTINHQKLEAYSRALSEKLSTDFFRKKAFASGDDILHFTPIEQVNLFIVKIVFDKWKEESERLRSPYFDYENNDVKAAQENLMVKLSQHIAIRREHFDNLLNKAIRDTLIMMADPFFFIKSEYFNRSTTTIEELRDRGKYIKVNKFLLQDLISRMEKENRSALNVIEVGYLLDKVFNEKGDKTENIHKHIDQFSQLLPLSENDLVNIVTQKPPIIQPKQEPVKQIIETPSPLVKEPELKNLPTLNDKHKFEEISLFEKHSKSKIEDIKTAFPLGQKFLFINELFNGDAGDFNNALEAINRSSDLRAAHELLKNNYAAKYNWQADKEEVKEFYEIIARRF